MNLDDPASRCTLISRNKPGLSQRKRLTARLQMAHSHSNACCSAPSHMDNCGEFGANTGDIPDFWGMIARMSHKFGAALALPFG